MPQVQELIAEAKKFYTVDNYCSDYIELIQDHSQLYKLLIRFESAAERQSKMHKRRADMIEALTTDLNPQFYLLVSLTYYVHLHTYRHRITHSCALPPMINS